jgi:hypothetical protein
LKDLRNSGKLVKPKLDVSKKEKEHKETEYKSRISVSDPDSIGSLIGIRIRAGKNYPQKKKKS